MRAETISQALLFVQGVSLPNEHVENREMGGRLARDQLKMKLPEFAGRTTRQTSGKYTQKLPLPILDEARSHRE